MNSLVTLDAKEAALDALLAWRAVDLTAGPHTDDGFMALAALRDTADRIHDELEEQA